MIFARSYDEVLAALLGGGVGVIPTDTVYGLACVVQNQGAVQRLYALKSRERKPGPIIAASVAQLKAFGIDPAQLARVEQFWPGPVSVILPHDKAYLHQGLSDQPFRIPGDKNLRKLLEQTGPLLTSSANQPGKPTAVTLAEAMAYFGDHVDFYVDGGDLSSRQASTIIRLTQDGRIEIVRPGAVDIGPLVNLQ